MLIRTSLGQHAKAMLLERAGMLIENGMSLVEVADGLAVEFKPVRQALEKTKVRVRAGDSFVQCLGDYKVISRPEMTLLIASEMAGRLPEGLAELTKFIEFVEDQKSLLRKSVVPNLLKIVAALSVLYLILVTTVPTMAQRVSQKDQDGMLVFVMSKHLTYFQENYGMSALAGVGVLLVSLISYLSKQEFRAQFANWAVRMMLKTPGVKKPILGFYLAIWARQGAMMVKSGISFKEFLQLTSTSFPVTIVKSLELMLVDVESHSWSKALNPKSWNAADPRHEWPLEFLGAMRAGGETGRLDEALGRLSNSLEKQSYRTLTKLAERIGFGTFIFAAGTVAFVVISILLSSLAGMNR